MPFAFAVIRLCLCAVIYISAEQAVLKYIPFYNLKVSFTIGSSRHRKLFTRRCKVSRVYLYRGRTWFDDNANQYSGTSRQYIQVLT